MSRAKVPVICPICRTKRWITDRHKSRRNRPCKRCHNKSIARKGYEATVSKYGIKFAIKPLRGYLLKHPSNLEVRVAQTLEGLGIGYEREFHLEPEALEYAGKTYLIDFAINVRGITHFIEVNGSYVHQFHELRDSQKMKCIEAAGFRVLVLDDDAVMSSDLPQIISRFLAA